MRLSSSPRSTPARAVLALVLFAIATPAVRASDGASTPSAANAMPMDVWDAFTGEWQVEANADDVVDHGVRTATAPMNFITRPIARRRLLSRFPAPTGLRLHRTGETFVIEFLGPESVTHTLPLSGAEVSQHGARLSVTLEHTTLRHVGATDEGRRVNLFRLGSSPDVLTMETIITSPQLPQPVHYTLSFRRLAQTNADKSTPAR